MTVFEMMRFVRSRSGGIGGSHRGYRATMLAGHDAMWCGKKIIVVQSKPSRVYIPVDSSHTVSADLSRTIIHRRSSIVHRHSETVKEKRCDRIETLTDS